MRFTVGAVLAVAALLDLVIQIQAQAPRVPSGLWTPAGIMTEVRSGASAALLQDGRVLITGGTGSTGVTDTAELFTADRGFTPAARMNTARTRHASIALDDGRVLVVGGFGVDLTPTKTAEVYDPASDIWTPVGSMAERRGAHTASLLADGRVLIAGGWTGSEVSSTFELFDPALNTFAVAQAPATPRMDHAAAGLLDGRVLLAGGSDGTAVLSSTDIFDPATGSASRGPNLSAFRSGLSATTLLNGQVLIAGGTDGSNALASAEIFDPAAGTVSLAASTLATARSGHLAFLLPHNNAALIVGGMSAGAPVASAELFMPWSGAFSDTGAMVSARAGAAGTALTVEGRLIVAGGGQSSAEIYAFATVKTDHLDYAPGETVTITGSGWEPLEAVTLVLHEEPTVHEDRVLTASADAGGNIFNDQFQPETHDAGARFYLTASGGRSQAQTTFTDADTREYSATISPTSDLAGRASASYTLTIKNETTSTKDLGSANITIPSGYTGATVVSVTAPPGKTWTATIVSGVIQLRASNNSSARLSPGQTVAVTITANAPCTAGAYQWTTAAKENSNFGGNDFTLVGSQPSVTITGSCNPTISINDVTVVEGNAGASNATFTVSLSAASGRTITVNFATADGTATVADGDYQSASGTLTFPPGTTSQSIIVLVNGDTKFEPDETFFVNLSNATNATIAKGTGTGTIANDDAMPTLSIDDPVPQAEGNAGASTITFTVTKTGSTSQTVTVQYATASGTAVGGADCSTAASGSPDFINASGTLTFAPGEMTKTIAVSVCGDTTFELDETFTVNLSNASNATITKGTGTGTIVNDDAPPTFSIDDVAQNEGNSGTTAFTFTVTKTGATSQTATVQFATADGTAVGNSSCAAAATGSPDYLSTSGTLSFGPTEPTKTITVSVCGDATFELTELFTVTLSNANNATITKGTGTGTIVNDDAMPTLSIDDVTRAEGNSGTTAFTFTVTKTGATSQTATVTFATADGTTNPAIGGANCIGSATGSPDYISQGGTLTFAPGETSKTITVAVCGDTIFENNEMFFVKLLVAVNATITDDQGAGTITNDDASPAFSINDVQQAEGDAATNFVFTVTLSGTTALPATVSFTTVPGSATEGLACSAGVDYLKRMGVLTFPPGTSSQQITVPVCGDNMLEANETFFVNLSSATNATIADAQGQGTILNDDFAPVINAITVTPEPSKEGEAVTVSAVFTDNDDLAGFACAVNFGDGTTQPGVVTPNLNGTSTCTSTHAYVDDGPSPGNGTPQDTYTVTVTVMDAGGNAGTATTNHVVQNVAPSITLIAVAPNPATSGTPVTVTAAFTDPGALDAHTCVINWGDGTSSPGTVSPPTGSGNCTGTHTYSAGGILTITVTVTDDDGGSDTDSAFICLTGLGEKVNGGGWIKQPFAALPDLGGMAYFGFNAKQHVGDAIPTGETNFKYRPANIHFHSTSYEALVVAITPDPLTPDRAQWWGSGTINGTGDYCFMVNVTDAGEPGKNDSIRMRIWQKVAGTTTCSVPPAAPPLLLYDNGFPTQSETTLGGGNIQIR